MTRERDWLLRLLKDNLQRAQLRMRNQANMHRTDKEFQVGDLVFIRLRSYRQSSIRTKKSSKLLPRYFGPFQILERIGKVAYRVPLLEEAKIHNVFHASLLKGCRGQTSDQPVTFPNQLLIEGLTMSPKQIIAQRNVKVQGQWVKQALVVLKHSSADETTWKPIRELKRVYPKLDLEDKVHSDPGSIVAESEQQKGADKERSRRMPKPSSRYPAGQYKLIQKAYKSGEQNAISED